MKGKHFAKPEKKNIKAKSIMLSVVAILEFLLLGVSVTFAWFEGVTSLEINGNNIATPTSINSHVVVGENSSESDTTFNQIIDLTSFYEEQNDVRLSPVSSADGVNFFAPYDYTSTTNFANAKYRKLSQEDINANVIRFQFTISSPSGPTDIYLSEIIPQFELFDTISSSALRMYAYRFAYSDGTVTHILSTRTSGITSVKSIDYLNADDTAHTVTGKVEYLTNYIYKSDHSTKDNVLFHLEKNETKTITFSMWLDALDAGWTKSNTSRENPARDTIGEKVGFIVKLCTSWSIHQNVTVYDYTAKQWVNNEDNMVLYVRNLDGDYGDGYDNRYLYPLTYNATAKTWTGDIPLALQNCEFVWKSTNTGKELATWKTYNRGIDEEICLLGSDDAIWGIGPDDVTKIALSDYTSENWLNNNGDDGQSPKMRIAIDYGDNTLNYSMTDSPTADKYGRNTWYAYIPTSVQEVYFYRCERSNESTIYNSWHGTERGTETVYRVKDSGSNTIYLDVSNQASNFISTTYNTSGLPYISVTHSDNHSANATDTSGANVDKYVPKNDTWNGTMTQIDGTDIYYYTFEDGIPSGTRISFWSHQLSGHDNVWDTNCSLGQTFDGVNNCYTLTTDNSTYNEDRRSYLFNGTWTTYSSANITDGNSGGEWGEYTVPSGSYTTRFVNYKSATSVTVTYNYDGCSFSLALTNEGSNIWTAGTSIPDGATDLVFTDSNGTTWSAGSGRSSSENYYYAIDSTTGTWQGSSIVIYVDFSNAGSNWGSGHYLSITASSNSGKNMNSGDTSGASSYVPKNDTWIGAGTNVSGSIYKWTIDASQLSNLYKYGFTVWSTNENNYDQVWSVDVSHVSFSLTYNTYTISSNKTTHNTRQADCFTLTASSDS